MNLHGPKPLTTKQRKAFLQKRINALQFLANDSLYQDLAKDMPKKFGWIKEELKSAQTCMKEKHYL